jgi:diguanylate cyclase (GGDEF)-like protein
MVHEDKLSAVLAEFARTMATDFPIQRILDHLVERIVEILPITAAGVTLIGPDKAPRYVAASDDTALRFEQLQTELGRGPCIRAYETGEAVSVPDLQADHSFGPFTQAALSAGLAAVFTFPLRRGDGQLGALDLYRDTPGVLDPDDLSAAQTLADVATAYLLNAQAREEASTTSEQFRYSALHDGLTGLPNRSLLQERLEHAAQRAQRTHSSAAVLFADLDGFKHINDEHGHEAGDEMLRAVAQRLAALVRPGDTLARVSGDEFVFLCEDLGLPADGERLARRIDEAFTRPFLLRGVEITTTASVGIAFAGPGERISNQLVIDADVAMYQAKRAGGGSHQIIDLREAMQNRDRDHLEAELRAATHRGELEAAYQPVVRASDGRLVGVEALLRWTHPDRGPIPAVSLIAAAEQSGLINEVGAWILDRACRDRQRWLRRQPDAPLDIAVNVSGRQLASPDFSATVRSVLERTGMSPEALILEVTESIFLEDTDRTTTALASLRATGVRIALDDFGTGYSSLSYLRVLPIDIVKIDRSFVADLGRTTATRVITEGVASMAHALGLSVTAEGVESRAQRDEIVAIGCAGAQGFFYAHPMPAAEIEALLADATSSKHVHLPRAHSISTAR